MVKVKRLSILLLSLFSLVLFLVACDGEEQATKEEEGINSEQAEETKENKEDKEEEEKITLRELDEDERELWEGTDIPYLLDKHDIIESIEWTDQDVSVHLKENKVTGIVEDDLFDSTNQIAGDIQEIVEWNYDVDEVPVNFFSGDKLVSKQNKHGIWINFKMPNWK